MGNNKKNKNKKKYKKNPNVEGESKKAIHVENKIEINESVVQNDGNHEILKDNEIKMNEEIGAEKREEDAENENEINKEDDDNHIEEKFNQEIANEEPTTKLIQHDPNSCHKDNTTEENVLSDDRSKISPLKMKEENEIKPNSINIITDVNLDKTNCDINIPKLGEHEKIITVNELEFENQTKKNEETHTTQNDPETISEIDKIQNHTTSQNDLMFFSKSCENNDKSNEEDSSKFTSTIDRDSSHIRNNEEINIIHIVENSFKESPKNEPEITNEKKQNNMDITTEAIKEKKLQECEIHYPQEGLQTQNIKEISNIIEEDLSKIKKDVFNDCDKQEKKGSKAETEEITMKNHYGLIPDLTPPVSITQNSMDNKQQIKENSNNINITNVDNQATHDKTLEVIKISPEIKKSEIKDSIDSLNPLLKKINISNPDLEINTTQEIHNHNDKKNELNNLLLHKLSFYNTSEWEQSQTQSTEGCSIALKMKDILSQLREKSGYTDNDKVFLTVNKDMSDESFYLSHLQTDAFFYKGILNLKLQRNKIGINQFSNGDTFVGNWKNNIKEGFGVYRYEDTNFTIYVGEWKSGQRTEGLYLTQCDKNRFDVFMGEFKDDSKHNGIFFSDSNKEIYRGRFYNNSTHDDEAVLLNTEERFIFTGKVNEHQYVGTFSTLNENMEIQTMINFDSESGKKTQVKLSEVENINLIQNKIIKTYSKWEKTIKPGLNILSKQIKDLIHEFKFEKIAEFTDDTVLITKTNQIQTAYKRLMEIEIK